MSFSSELLERSLEVEYPVTVILLDEEEEDERYITTQRHLEHEERTIQILPIGLDKDEDTDWTKVRRGSTDWSVEDSDPFLTKVNVVVDTDEERRHDDDDDDDVNYDDDDDHNNNYYDTSATESEPFRSMGGSQIFRDAFLSADDSQSNVGIQGHVTRRKFEVVEHETTRKCVILAPNTELDSNVEEKEDIDAVRSTLEQSAYDVAAALYHSSIKDQGSVVLPVVVFKMDSETQTSRNRTTQTGVDQSTMTDEELRQVPRRRRRRPRQRNPVEDFPRRTGQGLENEDGEQRSVAFENDDDQEWTEEEAPETTAPIQRPPRGLATHQDFSDYGGHSNTVAAPSVAQKVSVGQQTSSHTATQTPVLARLDANGSFWMPQEAMLLAGFENISTTGTDRFYYPLGNRDPDHHGNKAPPPRGHGNEHAPKRDFSTQTFGQPSRDGIPAETQTSLPGNGRLDDDDAESRENDGTVSGIDVEVTSKEVTSRGKHDGKSTKKGQDKGRRVKNKGDDRSKKAADIEGGWCSNDETKTDLLKLMLHEMKTLKRQMNKVYEDKGRREGVGEDGKGGGRHRRHHRLPRGNHLDSERNPDDRKSSLAKINGSVDRVEKWKKQLDNISRNYLDVSQRYDLEGGGRNRRRSVGKDWKSADDTHHRLRWRRNDDASFHHPGKIGKGHSSDVELIHRSLTLSPSRGHDLFHDSNKYFPNASQYDAYGEPRKHTLPRGHRHPNNDYPNSRPHPFRPLGTSSPALAVDSGRDFRSGQPLRRETRLKGSPDVIGDIHVARPGSRRKSLEPMGDNKNWKHRWMENVSPNSKIHLIRRSTIDDSSRRHHQRP